MTFTFVGTKEEYEQKLNDPTIIAAHGIIRTDNGTDSIQGADFEMQCNETIDMVDDYGQTVTFPKCQ